MEEIKNIWSKNNKKQYFFKSKSKVYQTEKIAKEKNIRSVLLHIKTIHKIHILIKEWLKKHLKSDNEFLST